MIIGTEAIVPFETLELAKYSCYEDGWKVRLTQGCLKFVDTFRAGFRSRVL